VWGTDHPTIPAPTHLGADAVRSRSVQLYGTPASHFTRKLRILLAELDVPFEFVRTPSVLAPTADAYGNNPLMRVPTLVDGDLTLIESDHIARYVVDKHDPNDRFGVLSVEPRTLNRIAITNGIMANEVVLILAKRGGLEAIDGVAYFRKLRSTIDDGLAWLDGNVDVEEPGLDYADMVMISMWQHALHYGFASADRHGRIAARVAQFSERRSVASTTPERSLADATAEGWRAG
jgi:glutathione S-transferase